MPASTDTNCPDPKRPLPPSPRTIVEIKQFINKHRWRVPSKMRRKEEIIAFLCKSPYPESTYAPFLWPEVARHREGLPKHRGTPLEQPDWQALQDLEQEIDIELPLAGCNDVLTSFNAFFTAAGARVLSLHLYKFYNKDRPWKKVPGSLPASIGNLTGLARLDINIRSLESLPDAIGHLQGLSELWITNNKIMALPGSIRNLFSLESMTISSTQLAVLPSSVCHLPQLKYLELRDNQLNLLPEEFGSLTHLVSFSGSGNRLARLPDSFTQLDALERLDLVGNLFTEFPTQVCHLRHLKECNMARNQIISLPAEIGDMKNLASLTLSENFVGQFPASFNRLQSLRVLRIQNNGIHHLPPCLAELANLRECDLLWHPIFRVDGYNGNLLEDDPVTMKVMRALLQSKVNIPAYSNKDAQYLQNKYL